MYVCKCICMYICICMHVCICMFVYVYMYIHVCMYIRIFTYINVYRYIHTCISVYVCTCQYFCKCFINIRKYTYIYIHIYEIRTIHACTYSTYIAVYLDHIRTYTTSNFIYIHVLICWFTNDNRSDRLISDYH